MSDQDIKLYTPFPWVIDRTKVDGFRSVLRDASGWSIAYFTGPPIEVESPRTEISINLCAAAPEMLFALQDMISLAETLKAHHMLTVTAKMIDKRLQRAKQVIQKAKGK